MNWVKVCALTDLTPDVGAAARVGDEQVALFYLPQLSPAVYALDNWDPLGEAFVISRGIVGDQGGIPCVASPLYKHHYQLADGRCLEESAVALRVWPVRLDGGEVYIQSRGG
ncbi:nitrite reductase small subunit NirD [Pseudaeromonas sharmana]|uniref:Nitrite reductase small subunit NirD n=1 Tax=Pseudaeromonas sharmana TaxID=328412 RepID=A0ABV8CP59_9GAMM